MKLVEIRLYLISYIGKLGFEDTVFIEADSIYDWFICDMDSIKELAFYDCHYLNTHKATVQELIEHFKGDKSEEVTHHIGI